MNIETVNGWPKGRKAKYLISDSDASQINAIRRAILSDVPKLAIAFVDFTQGVNQDNEGEVVESVNALPDEVIAHRLAMLPFRPTPMRASTSLTSAPTAHLGGIRARLHAVPSALLAQRSRPLRRRRGRFPHRSRR